MKAFKFLLNYKWRFVLVIAASLVASLSEGLGFTFIIPILQGDDQISQANLPDFLVFILKFFDHMTPVERISFASLWLFLITLMKAGLLFAVLYMSARLQTMTVKHFRMRCFDQSLRQSLKHWNQSKSGFFQTLYETHCVQMGFIVNNVTLFFAKVLNILVLLVILFLLSWKMVCISLGLVVFASLLLNGLVKGSYHAGRDFTLAQRRMNQGIAELIKGMKLIRLFSKEASFLKRLEERVDAFNGAFFKRSIINGSVKPIFEVLAISCVCMILLFGALIQGVGGVSIAVLLTFIVIFYRIAQQAMELNRMRIDLKSCESYLKEMTEFLFQEDNGPQSGSKKVDHLMQKISFENVSFSYGRSEEMVLKNVNLSIKKGQTVGVVGGSGSGKSTLIELLMRFYDPNEGAILIDGVDLKQVDLHVWRSLMGVVSQDNMLFNTTIKENIAFACDDATDADIEDAARQAFIHDFIMSLPDGYETVVGEQGVLLSGGQKQRIAIARAILLNPDILIFDEATSALDSESEQIVQEALDNLGKDKTVIMIAHRLSTVMDADIIFVLSEGRVVEQNSHKELMKAKGVYWQLVNLQGMS